MKKTIIVIGLLGLLGKIVGFGRELSLAYYFGVSDISDAYLIAITIPTVVFAFVATAIQSTFIPMYSRILMEDGKEKANEYVIHLLIFLTILSSLIIFIFRMYPYEIVKIFAIGFDKNLLELTVQLTSATLWSIYFIGIISIFEGLLQINKKYIYPAIIGIPLNIVIIFSIALGYEQNIAWLGYGQVVAVITQFLFLLPAIINLRIKTNIYNSLRTILRSRNLLNTMSLAGPVILGSSVNQINKIVDKSMASNFIEGGITSLVYANRFNLFLQSIFILAISSVMFPLISKLVVQKRNQDLLLVFNKAVGGLCLLLLPLSFITIIFSKEIISVLFGRGNFDNEAIKQTATVLIFYSIGTLSLGLRELTSRVFFAMQDTKTPTINAIIGVTLNIVLNLTLPILFGVNGIALASSISAIVISYLMFVSLKTKKSIIITNAMKKDLSKIVIINIIVFAVVSLNKFYMLNDFIDSSIMRLIIGGGSAIVMYIVLNFLFRVNVFNEIFVSYKIRKE